MLENIVDNLRINSQPKRKDTPFQINVIIYDDAIMKQVKKSMYNRHKKYLIVYLYA